MDNSLTRTNPPSLYDSVALGYSQITTVEPGRLAFISGQVAWRPHGEPVPQDLAEQAKIVMDNARRALDAIGASSQDIVMARVFMIDVTPERQEVVLQYMRRLFDGVLPCVTGLGIVALGGPDLQLELELIVRAPS